MFVSFKLWDWWADKTGYVAITIWPFVVIHSQWKDHMVIGNHEEIHLRQQKELLVIPFFVLYLINFVVNLFRFKFNWSKSYNEIVFEKEAYAKERNMHYLEDRKFWAWLKYL